MEDKNECRWLKPRYNPSSPLGACREKYSRKRGEIKVSASPWKTIPTTIIKATGCMVRMVDSGFSIFPEAMHKADNGMINIPTVIEVRAVR